MRYEIKRKPCPSNIDISRIVHMQRTNRRYAFLADIMKRVRDVWMIVTTIEATPPERTNMHSVVAKASRVAAHLAKYCFLLKCCSSSAFQLVHSQPLPDLKYSNGIWLR